MPTFPFSLGIDHANKKLQMSAGDNSGQKITASMDAAELAGFMAILSQCQHALVLSLAGQEVKLPIDPEIAFQPQAGNFALGAFETIAKVTVGIDENLGAVALVILSHPKPSDWI